MTALSIWEMLRLVTEIAVLYNHSSGLEKKFPRWYPKPMRLVPRLLARDFCVLAHMPEAEELCADFAEAMLLAMRGLDRVIDSPDYDQKRRLLREAHNLLRRGECPARGLTENETYALAACRHVKQRFSHRTTRYKAVLGQLQQLTEVIDAKQHAKTADDILRIRMREGELVNLTLLSYLGDFGQESEAHLLAVYLGRHGAFVDDIIDVREDIITRTPSYAYLRAETHGLRTSAISHIQAELHDLMDWNDAIILAKHPLSPECSRIIRRYHTLFRLYLVVGNLF